MKVLTEKDRKEIIQHLKNNHLCAIKTDTVFGIMAIMSKENEIKINHLKQSPLDKRISIIVENTDYLKKQVENLTSEEENMVDHKLPGKYTFIVKLKHDFCTSRGFERQDFGVRVTTNTFLQDLIKETGPLLASSCNISGKEPCSNTKEIIKQFQDTNLMVVDGIVTDNTPSTIISFIEHGKIIRK